MKRPDSEWLAEKRKSRLATYLSLGADTSVVARVAAQVIYSDAGGSHWSGVWWMLKHAIRMTALDISARLYGIRYRMFGSDPMKLYREDDIDF